MRCSTKPRSARSARRTHEGRTKEVVPGPCPQPGGGPDVTAARHAHPATGDARRVTELGVGAGPVRRKRGVAGDSTSGRPEFGVDAGNNTELRPPAPHPTARRGITSPPPTH